MQSRCVTAFNRVMWVKTKKPRPRLLVFLCIIVCLLTHLPVTRKVASSFHSSLHSQTWVRWCVGACMAHFIVLGCITMVITTLSLITMTHHYNNTQISPSSKTHFQATNKAYAQQGSWGAENKTNTAALCEGGLCDHRFSYRSGSTTTLAL